MDVALPHYRLYSECVSGEEPGRWRFVLREADGRQRLVASDVEPGVHGQRLELLSAVRGLEALDRPCRVTLITPSIYVREGIRYGLEDWKTNDWRWESFGRMVPVKNGDLWRRVDQAMQFHRVECVTWRLDPAHPTLVATSAHVFRRLREPLWRRWRYRLFRLWVRSRRRVTAGLRELAQAAAVCF
ncbi:MAG: hypothetical protein JW809_18900 [Pirellulales bacterium]|nr:hypothetical protein [Pirellulales bacterium]